MLEFEYVSFFNKRRKRVEKFPILKFILLKLHARCFRTFPSCALIKRMNLCHLLQSLLATVSVEVTLSGNWVRRRLKGFCSATPQRQTKIRSQTFHALNLDR